MKITCPICENKTTWEENHWRPFCSERCKLIDLGKWATEEYRIPEDEAKSKGQREDKKEQ
ncbi:MAG: DNA gyrase inhibitor YacG [Nitrospira sp.]|nr:DNA gyrase inhibitor YacG [Nitrospira sp.]